MTYPEKAKKVGDPKRRASPEGLVEDVNEASMVGFADEDKLSDRSIEATPPLLSYNDRCEEHPDELIVAYHKITLLHLCSQCISSQNLAKEHYVVYPQIVSQIKEKIDSCRQLIRFRKSQLEQTVKFIKRKAKSNKDELQSKFTRHIDELMDFFEDYRERQEEIVNEAVVLQESRVDDVCGELDEYMSKLEADG